VPARPAPRWTSSARPSCGFGHVKQRHIAAAKADEAALLEQFCAGGGLPMLKAAE
jgi:hypothetical protein